VLAGWSINLFIVETAVCYVLAGRSIDLFIVETAVCYVETGLKLLSKTKTVNVIAYWRSK